ncbi:TPA: hypothetical protein ACQ49O_005609 [Klebsiella pneumoniae]|jgi:hypothetical protein|uniref:Lipoprotein n=19 Tax=Enterobacteriaceae TaxID=543 RepID=A0A8T3UPD4_ECOLX|nr:MULTISPECIES: hypothetical protein [Enterobacterales]EBN9829868.1 hypothetical protein [Salmonella enterica subsp. enterica serovar Senftenberg]EBP4126940.1 hypothetical protein [Salmonella enterica subsp. enterica]EBQ6262300.1 hypothetical protein [Salmonella enterica subsp. enterica serovar Virchow]EBY8735571.1 hypothetical protein [Salmonella enterica subsp. enterica serovar Grumpensis]ECD7259046.1 hypothetical protein [Salmonella enterica subsp. enterica serovar Mbandaka]ECE8705271.1 h
MKLANKIVLPLLVVITGVITSGCSGTGKPQRTYLDETRNLPARAEYPYQYQYSESWRGTERGGAAIRYPGYEHTLVSPYAINDPSGKRYVAHDNYTQVLLTSVANTKYANGPRGTFTQTPAFCGENTFLLPNNTQNASRAEYLRIKDKYCSTPGYRLSAHELNVLSSGEPEELRKYRIQMQIDNQQPKS